MTIISMNILSLPLALMIWMLDSCLFLVVMRLTIGRFAKCRSGRLYRPLQELTDPLQQIVIRRLSKHTSRSMRPWASWLLLITGLSIARFVIMCVLVLVG